MIGKAEKEAHPDGRITWALTTKLPWRDKEGKIIGTYGLSKDITAIKEAEIELERMHRRLLETSRLAGMAEVAADVLHNIGNVLNSVNVSASLAADKLRDSKVSYLVKAMALLREHAADLGTFLTADPRGRQLPGYLNQVTESLITERDILLQEMLCLNQSVEHIKEIVAAQNNYARVSGVVETVKIADVIEDALRVTACALAGDGITVTREYEPQLPDITVDKHKVLLILGNLIRNARSACEGSGGQDKRLTMRVSTAENHVEIQVADNGAGILPEHLALIFNHGFTLRKDGQGFGLHSAALAAKELGGSLRVHSDGPGFGATFILKLPFQAPPSARRGAVVL
jgi:signal transduction histidine kinase